MAIGLSYDFNNCYCTGLFDKTCLFLLLFLIAWFFDTTRELPVDQNFDNFFPRKFFVGNFFRPSVRQRDLHALVFYFLVRGEFIFNSKLRVERLLD